MINSATNREIERWYKLYDHPVQNALVNDRVRYKVVPAGRRSGKTERFKRFVVRESFRVVGDYFAGAPTYKQAKRIFWQDLNLLSFSSTHPRQPNKTDLTIYVPNGSTISVIGFDKPARFEGQPWHGGGIDEFGDIKDGAWESHISPALDTVNPTRPDYRAWCWLFGVPEGLNHYYDRYKYAKSGMDDDWRAYHWKSADILPPDVIEAKMRTMSASQFAQEYEASFETATGRIYPVYTEENHSDCQIKPHEQLLWAHDQNYTPLSSTISVYRDGKIYVCDEIVLTSALAEQSALEFVERYKDHKNKKVIIYGDPAGKAGEKHGHRSDYTALEGVLRNHGWIYHRRVPNSHPAIKDRQNAVRAKICNAAGERSLFVNPVKAKWLDKGLSTVQLKDGSAFQEDEKNKYQHITTAIGYQIAYDYPVNNMAYAEVHLGGI